MEINGEKQRTLNLIEKIGDVSKKHGTKELAQRLVLLDSFKSAIDNEMSEIKNILLDKGDEKMKEIFPEEGVKVVFQKGAEMYSIDTEGVFQSGIVFEDFLQIAKITEGEFKRINKLGFGKKHDRFYDENFLDKYKNFEKFKSDSISVKSLTKDELKEYTK